MAKRAIIIGAGPAGLTAAYELITRTNIEATVIEQDPIYVGGIARTVNYKGNRIDVGGHRFFSKSDRVMRWWAEMLPIAYKEGSVDIAYQRMTRPLTAGLRKAAPLDGERIMHVRPRKSRIIYGGTFFNYPIELSFDALLKLGLGKVIKIGLTYLYAVLFPRPEKTLEDFFLNRFGRELYTTFFKSYTEKVWGMPCKNMSAEWGVQRIKRLSIGKAIMHAMRTQLRRPVSGRAGETSLIEYFLYPTFGPGQMWEATADSIRSRGGAVYMGSRVTNIVLKDGYAEVGVEGAEGTRVFHAEYVFSSTDVRSLIHILSPRAPHEVRDVAVGLQYREFLTVGLLLAQQPTEADGSPITDNWMYIHEPDIRACRAQFYHNWQPALVADPRHGWIGLEYFCNDNDELWHMSDAALIELASSELEKLGLSRNIRIIDGTVIRQPKAYPGYFGSYNRFDVVRRYLDSIPYLFPIGRNGMHRYNNQDHSMLAAMESVDMLVEGRTDKSALWSINTEEEYHESKG
ncbi:hypothetical protein A2763_00310 [Candidatus Kaiserbacteria bacterium RIFCSPHIGHO2_01_FULL_54_36]|uniref:Amine oxidase domain-containing protein n=1 Tax=Candidatus Kaiserbacteria bacterium RIFCSPHIGHO2_01_FULL_54_36 TaxID=1798482 RepID=A0A1F6CL36_9BACT|nr:MAG: hypothetical protein A2763_00310 [Candidatus Kaiserbacteria bacterium RIFCSPHIGHO2_01_FULL_54_36]OGG75680.1 MAG: hypothetical protein A3A41_04725 [Candidatus Kaiserbacteria bacterium RIFCSPLOWO2_01_FULL_54_22]